MTLFDSSVLIDYLDGDADAIAYVESHVDQRAIAPPLVLFEVYQGEVFKSGPADFAAVDRALGWVTISPVNQEVARAAATIQNSLQQRGETLAARDAFIAGTASALGEQLAVSDTDFDVPGITEVLAVDFV